MGFGLLDMAGSGTIAGLVHWTETVAQINEVLPGSYQAAVSFPVESRRFHRVGEIPVERLKMKIEPGVPACWVTPGIALQVGN